MHRLVAVSLVAAAALAATGCGPNCQSTCERLYGTTGESCSISRPGTTATELLTRCSNECEGALSVPGELEGYDPNERQGSSASVQLENEKQAAIWMDCIAETACEDLNKGYCAPVW